MTCEIGENLILEIFGSGAFQLLGIADMERYIGEWVLQVLFILAARALNHPFLEAVKQFPEW